MSEVSAGITAEGWPGNRIYLSVGLSLLPSSLYGMDEHGLPLLIFFYKRTRKNKNLLLVHIAS